MRRCLFLAAGVQFLMTARVLGFAVVFRSLPAELRDGAAAAAAVNQAVMEETIAYAAYLNAPRGHLDASEQALLEEDTMKARAAMERAWLDAKPTRGKPL